MSYKIQTVIEQAHKKLESFVEYLKYLRVIGNNYKYTSSSSIKYIFLKSWSNSLCRLWVLERKF